MTDPTVAAAVIVAADAGAVLAVLFAARRCRRRATYRPFCGVCQSGLSNEIGFEGMVTFILVHERKHPGQPEIGA